MNSGGYYTVFDVSTAGFRSWPGPAIGVLFVVISAALVVRSTIGASPAPLTLKKKWFPRCSLGFAVLWTTVVFTITYGDYRRALAAMRSGRVPTVAGVVEHFIPMPAAGHALESFTVRGEEFRYSDYEITAGFNNTASHGGPIREGLEVKIWYLGNEILRLDVEGAAGRSVTP